MERLDVRSVVGVVVGGIVVLDDVEGDPWEGVSVAEEVLLRRSSRSPEGQWARRRIPVASDCCDESEPALCLKRSRRSGCGGMAVVTVAAVAGAESMRMCLGIVVPAAVVVVVT